MEAINSSYFNVAQNVPRLTPTDSLGSLIPIRLSPAEFLLAKLLKDTQRGCAVAAEGGVERQGIPDGRCSRVIHAVEGELNPGEVCGQGLERHHEGAVPAKGAVAPEAGVDHGAGRGALQRGPLLAGGGEGGVGGGEDPLDLQGGVAAKPTAGGSHGQDVGDGGWDQDLRGRLLLRGGGSPEGVAI